MKKEELRKILIEIYDCASAWDNDDGTMARANEKTPEDILKEYLDFKIASAFYSSAKEQYYTAMAKLSAFKPCIPFVEGDC